MRYFIFYGEGTDKKGFRCITDHEFPSFKEVERNFGYGDGEFILTGFNELTEEDFTNFNKVQ